MVIDIQPYFDAQQAEMSAAEAALAAVRAEARQQVNLEWVLADLLADIQAA